MRYSKSFKAKMVSKMVGPQATSANALARETGVHQTTLSRWRQEAVKLSAMSNKSDRPRRPEDWSPEEKLALVLEAAAVPDEDLGAFLRRNGVLEAHLAEWRTQMVAGLKVGRRETFKGNSPDARRARELERELRRKEAALAETAALLVLQKKARAIWGAEDDSTPRRSGK